MKILFGALSAILGVLSLIILYMNYRIWFDGLKWKPGEKHISMLPIIGGLLGFFALRLTRFAAVPLQGLEGYAWLPPLLDPGCYIALIYLYPCAIVFKRLFGPLEAS